MASPDPQQHAYPRYTQPPLPPPYPHHPEYEHDGRRAQSYPPRQPASYAGYAPPQYGVAPPIPYIAELPTPPPPTQAPLQPSLFTTTSREQLNDDELLARRLQDMEVEEARRRSLTPQMSHSDLRAPSLPPRPRPHSQSIPTLRTSPSMLQPRPHSQLMPGLIPVADAPLARPHSQSIPSQMPWSPGSFGPPPSNPPQSILPEVVVPERRLSIDGLEIPSNISIPSLTRTPTTPTDVVSLARHLDQFREVPLPPQWVLPPITQTLYASSTRAPKASWLDTPPTREWRTLRPSQNAISPVPPTYSFTFRSKGGSFRDPRLSWTMAPGPWTYNLRIDLDTNVRRFEQLTPPHAAGAPLITTYLHASNYDSMRFVGNDGRLYMWVAHAPLSSTHGGRYDVLRHALFVAGKGVDPLYGSIVADHTFWDGVIDYAEVHRGAECAGCGATPINGMRWRCQTCEAHDVCERCREANASVKPTCTFALANLPAEALNIRSSTVDPALVVASLQVMKDWEMATLRRAKRMDPEGFRVSEERAREGELGKVTYWKWEDAEGGEMEKKKPEPKRADSHRPESRKSEESVAKSRKSTHSEADETVSVGKIGELIKASALIGGMGTDVGVVLGEDEAEESRRSSKTQKT